LLDRTLRVLQYQPTRFVKLKVSFRLVQIFFMYLDTPYK